MRLMDREGIDMSIRCMETFVIQADLTLQIKAGVIASINIKSQAFWIVADSWSRFSNSALIAQSMSALE